MCLCFFVPLRLLIVLCVCLSLSKAIDNNTNYQLKFVCVGCAKNFKTTISRSIELFLFLSLSLFFRCNAIIIINNWINKKERRKKEREKKLEQTHKWQHWERISAHTHTVCSSWRLKIAIKHNFEKKKRYWRLFSLLGARFFRLQIIRSRAIASSEGLQTDKHVFELLPEIQRMCVCALWDQVYLHFFL